MRLSEAGRWRVKTGETVSEVGRWRVKTGETV